MRSCHFSPFLCYNHLKIGKEVFSWHHSFKSVPKISHCSFVALQSLETVPDTWFGSVDDPSLISEMKNAARALPVKLRLKTLQLSSLDVLALQQACCYQCLECKLSRQDYKLLEDYSNQFAALLASGNLGMLQ